MKKKVTYIISNINKAIAFEWIAAHMDPAKVELSFILFNQQPSYLFQFLKEKGFNAYEFSYAGKKDLPAAIVRCIRLLRKIKSDAVHCHLFDANMIGLTAARLAGIKQRIYTRHHSTFHHDYFPKAVKWDRYCNWISTDIIAISETVKDVLVQRESVDPSKITKIYHGFELEQFSQPDARMVSDLREKYNPAQKSPVVGVISRFVELKGVHLVIAAFRDLLKKYPNALLLLFNAKGDYEKNIDALLAGLPEGSYRKIVFENNVTALYRLFDMLIHVPLDKDIEAFGQIYIESMAAGVPLIATRSGIGNEILVDRMNSMVVPYKNASAIYDAMISVLENSELRKTITRNGFSTIQADFTIEKMTGQLENLYLH